MESISRTKGSDFGGRTQNRQWSHRKVSRGEGMKREREEEGRGRRVIFYGRVMRQPSWRDMIDI
jgi:hypothetical protein